MNIVVASVAFGALAWVAAKLHSNSKDAKTRELLDPNSYANNQDALVTHIHLSLIADFEKKTLSGTVKHTVKILKRGLSELILDTRDLKIEGVSVNGVKAPFVLEKEHPAFGRALTIKLPPTRDASVDVTIQYSTSPEATAIQWLPPEQTAGKKYPYLFTQCQAIHARALLPCQDTPSTKCTYTASITVPRPLRALMSAASTESISGVTYTFEQLVPMPSYLIALAIGNLEKRDISKRCAVWSEPEMVERAHWEFAETEQFLTTAEGICGPYDWDRYDILLLPPSFPYGGMENPRLTFVTPTLLAGDRSLTDVVAHEISHSWMGNLVTSHTWEHFWLNEGFTVYVERKIVKALRGNPAAHLSAIMGWHSLQECVDRYGPTHPYTVMNVKLAGIDPDDAFSTVPYEKGFNLLFYLEQIVGEEAMNSYLKAHCKRFRFSTVSSNQFVEYFCQHIKSISPDLYKRLDKVDWHYWLHAPGMPPKPKFDTSLVDASEALAQKLLSGARKSGPEFDISSWSSPQVVVFLEKLQTLQEEFYKKGNSKEAFAEILAEIDGLYHFTDSKNAEIRFRWFSVCIRAEYDAVFQATVRFLLEQGRMKFVRPLYRALFASEKGKSLAIDVFKKNRHIYHSITQKMVARDLKLES